MARWYFSELIDFSGTLDCKRCVCLGHNSWLGGICLS